jgi:hypothetical protein
VAKGKTMRQIGAIIESLVIVAVAVFALIGAITVSYQCQGKMPWPDEKGATHATSNPASAER